MKKGLIALALVAAMTAVVVRQQMKICELEKALAEKPAVERIVEKIPAAAPVPRREVAVEAAGIVPVPMPVVAPQPAPAIPSATAPASKPAPNMGDLFKNIGSMMTNPAMKEMIRTQARMQLDMQYGRLFKFLNKSPEQLAALKDVLMDRQMALMDGSMALMSGDTTAEERKKKAEEVKAVKDSYDKKIADLLGPDDNDAFKQYENTQPERMQAELFKNTIASSGEPLTDQQEYDLVNAMYSARTNAPAAAALMKQDEAPDPAQFTAAGMTNMLAQMDKMQQQYAAAAATILTPAQNDQFKKFAEQQKAMQEMGIKFAAQMFGGGSNSTPAAVPPNP